MLAACIGARGSLWDANQVTYGALLTLMLDASIDQVHHSLRAACKRACGVLLNSTSTGKVRPGILKTGTLPKKSLNFLASRVAEVTISLKSRRRATTCGRRRVYFGFVGFAAQACKQKPIKPAGNTGCKLGLLWEGARDCRLE